MKQDLDRLDVGRLTLCPFSPGSPGSPSKPLSPCTSTHQYHYIATYPGETGAAWRFMLVWHTLPCLLAHQAFHVHRQLQVGPKTKERMKEKETALLILRLVFWSLLTFKNVTFHATVLLRDLPLQKHCCWTFLFSSAQEQLSSLYPHSQLAHESSLPYWFAHEWFMFISNQLGQDV